MAVVSSSQIASSRLARRRVPITGIWVTTREAFWLALESLRTHKLRSFLTLLGVVIATTTLIVVMSVVNGMNLYIATKIANLGTNTFVVAQFKWAQGYDEMVKAMRRNRPIRLEEYQYLRDNLRGYQAISALAQLQPAPRARYQGESIDDISLIGITPSHVDIGREKVLEGRYLTEQDYNHNAMVCFIGQDLVQKFFPNVDPLGKEIIIEGHGFTVVGTAEKVGTTFGISQDNFAFIPLSTFRAQFMPRLDLMVFIKAPDSKHMMELEDETRALLRARRHIPYHDDDNFGVNASETLMAAWSSLTGTIFAVMIAIVAVFMVVGGVVIMNIMLASVTERTHEIGIRKSLGARRRDILSQFIIEAAVMAMVGGILGVLFAMLISWGINHVFTSSIPLSAVIVGLFLSVSVGLFFGIYPANKASRLDPIEALRTEN